MDDHTHGLDPHQGWGITGGVSEVPVLGVVVIVSEQEVRKWALSWLPTVGNKNICRGKSRVFWLKLWPPKKAYRSPN